MQQNMIYPHMSLRSNRFMTVVAGTLMFIFLLTSCVKLCTDSASNTGVLVDPFASGGNNNVVEAGCGPTMLMSYSKEEVVENPIASFLYFVPLIASTSVDNISNVHNDQQVGVISHKIKNDSRTFSVVCEFEILGTGFHMNTFDPAGMIAAQVGDVKKGKTLTNLLDYIRIEDQGYGIIEVKGGISKAAWTVTEVNLNFNVKAHKSPVTIGLYDIKQKDGEYQYKNRSNETVARVNSLAFKKTEQTPRMGIKVASIARKNKSASFFGSIKGVFANMLIEPLAVDQQGNRTMLEFGEALVQQQPAFTFPKAENIKEINVVEMDTIQK